MLQFAKQHAVCLIAGLAAVVTMLFVPPSPRYLAYLNWNTLGCIFCVLAVVAAAKRLGVFDVLARGVVRHFGTARSALCALVGITLVASMFVTNDMALIMFLPLAAMVLFRAGQARLVPLCFVMQDVAANLGGMIMPFGSPQNLFVFANFDVTLPEFLGVMAPPFVLSVVLIFALCLLATRPLPIEVHAEGVESFDRCRALVYAALFALTLLGVFRVLPIAVPMVVVALALLVFDRGALLDVDYGLLLTFVFFFVFSGNMAQIPAVQAFFSQLLEANTLLCAALASQALSNVPVAVLFAQFTTDWAGLLAGVNIGGAGTLVASLASVITYNQFRAIQHVGLAKDPETARRFGTGRYLALFSAINFAFLGILLAFCLLLGY